MKLLYSTVRYGSIEKEIILSISTYDFHNDRIRMVK